MRSAARLPKAPPKASSKRGSQAKPRRPKTTNKVGDEKKVRTSSLSGVENNDNASKLTSSWRWPTTGKVVAEFDADSGKKGIDITGRSGQPIFSAAAGDVVYSGNGLLGYGNLVIIKHDDIYLSAYGHNSQLLVKEGDKVTSGQEIAKMGVSPKEGATLHFEIRKEGKPVDPQRYLPKKN
jgi:lipoprotein NlpD